MEAVLFFFVISMDFKSVYLLLTPACNLKCRYCFQENEYHDPGNGAVSADVIGAFAEFCRGGGVQHVELFGGEPLLYRDRFIHAVRTLREKLPEASLGVVTNGTLIDEEIMDLLESAQVSVLLSLDGRRERHDAFRGGFERISRWFPRLTATGRTSVALQAGTVEGMSDHIRYIFGLGFEKVYVNVIQNYGWYKSGDVETFEGEYEKAVLAMLDGAGELLCATQLQALMESSRSDQGCGITYNALTCDWTGRLFPCHRAPEMGERFAIGNVRNGVDEEADRNLRLRIRSAIAGSEAARKYPLVSFCPVNVYLRHGDFTGDWPDGFCRMIERKAKIVAKYHYEIEKYLQEKVKDPRLPDRC